MSSKGVRRRRQVARLQHAQAARVRRARRQLNAAWAQRTRAERRMAAAERWRRRQRAADEHRETLLRRVMVPGVASVAVPALTFLGLTGLPGPHPSYPVVLPGPLGGLALPAPDVPHLPELPVAFSARMAAAGGTVSTFGQAAWYSLYGPHLTED